MAGPFEKLFDVCKRKPVWLPVVLALVLAASIAGALRVEFAEDIFALLPRDEPVVAEAQLAIQRYQGLERIVVALESDDPAALAAAVDAADASLRGVNGISAVVSRIERTAQDDIAELYIGRTPLLFDAPMQQAIEQRLTTPYFESALQRYLDAQAGQEGLTVVDTFRGDPFGFNELTLRRFERLNGGLDGRSDAQGRILSRDGRFAIIMLEADIPSSDTGRGRELMAAIEAAMPSGVVAHVIGAHRSSVDNAQVLRDDLNVTIATSVIAILLLFLLVFRAVTPILVTLLSVGFGFAVALGTQGWLHGQLSAITAGFAAVLLGISVDYAVHLVTTYGSLEGDRDSRARAALHHVARPGFIAMVTTVLAISMLRFSSFDGLLQLAEMAVAGIAGALAFAFVAGAQILRRFGPKPRAALGISNFIGLLQAARHKARWLLLGGMLGLTVVFAAFAPSVGFDGDVMNLDGKSDRTRESEASVAKAFGQETLSRTLVVSGGGNLEAALRASDLVARDLHQLNARHESIAWVLPASETQRENIARWRRFWNDARLESLKKAMAAAKAKHPNDGREISFSVERLPGAFPSFFDTLQPEADPDTLDPAKLHDRPIWQLLGHFMSEQDGRVYAGTTAQLDASTIGELKARQPGAIVLNKAAFVSRMLEFIRGDLLLMGGLSLLLVVVVLTLTFRRPRDVLIALVPVAGGMAWTLGLMSLLGIPFNIINTLVTVFVAGLGIDYGIFFVQTYRGSTSAANADARLKLAGAGVLVAALTTLFGFGSLALANHPALFSVGITTGIGVASALLLTLLVVPTLLELRPKEET